MTVTHAGSTKKYSAGWDNIFSGTKGSKATTTKKVAAKKKSPTKKKSKR
ncbi:MAG TPA: hypothetical protein VHC22_25260 [Pirellulales bacterium]|nr:hypothetical protein [Pirellulales bacterium]